MNLSIQERKSKRAGMITSILLHALLLLLFLYLYLQFMRPPQEASEEGILINFGVTESGAGDIQPEQKNDVTQPVTPPAPTEEPEPTKEEEKVLTQNVEEAPVIEKKKETKEKTETVQPKKEEKTEKKAEEQPKEEPKRVANPNLLYKGKQNTAATSSEGVKTGKGDQGTPDGDPNAKNHEGNKSLGLGDEGIGFDLKGRKMLRKPVIHDKSQEYGKVAVSIKVDRNGKVVFAKYTQKGSTTTSNYLIGLAEKAAFEAQFNADPAAAEEQWGAISFTFKVK